MYTAQKWFKCRLQRDGWRRSAGTSLRQSWLSGSDRPCIAASAHRAAPLHSWYFKGSKEMKRFFKTKALSADYMVHWWVSHKRSVNTGKTSSINATCLNLSLYFKCFHAILQLDCNPPTSLSQTPNMGQRMNWDLLKLGFYYLFLHMFEILHNNKLKYTHAGRKKEKSSDILKSKPTTLEFSL